MAAPLMLGGITVPPHAGTPDVSYAEAGGATDVTLAGGATVRMRHWRKELITISGTGWMSTGLDALDWDAQHTLRCPKPKRMATTGTSVTLTSDPRPDVPVGAHALVGKSWVPTPVTRSGRAVTITPVPGASQYSVYWYPQFTVLVTPPTEENAGDVSWQLICREV